MYIIRVLGFTLCTGSWALLLAWMRGIASHNSKLIRFFPLMREYMRWHTVTECLQLAEACLVGDEEGVVLFEQRMRLSKIPVVWDNDTSFPLNGFNHEGNNIGIGFQLVSKGYKVIVRNELETRHVRTYSLEHELSQTVRVHDWLHGGEQIRALKCHHWCQWMLCLHWTRLHGSDSLNNTGKSKIS